MQDIEKEISEMSDDNKDIFDSISKSILFDSGEIDPFQTNVVQLLNYRRPHPDFERSPTSVIVGNFDTDDIAQKLSAETGWDDNENYNEFTIYEPPTVNAQDIAVGDEVLITRSAGGIDNDATVKPYIDAMEGSDQESNPIYEEVAGRLEDAISIFLGFSENSNDQVPGYGWSWDPPSDTIKFVFHFGEAGNVDQEVLSQYERSSISSSFESDLVSYSKNTDGPVVVIDAELENLKRYRRP
ncbi:hypothetical protein ACFQHN_33630 [Natrialbaceae archaeon GCM10025896]